MRTRQFFFLLAICILLLLSCAAEETSAGVAAENPYNLTLSRITADFVHASAPEKAVLLARAYRLRDYVDSPAEVDAWLKTVAYDNSVPRLVRDECLRYLAIVALHRGETETAQRTIASLGMVRQWALLGPLPLTDAAGHEFASPHALSAALASKQDWREVDPGPQPWLDLADFFPQRGSAVAFARTSIYSDVRRTVVVRFTADSAIALQLNGATIYSDSADSGAAFDQHAVTAQLLPGWNSLLLMLTHRTPGQWRFELRLTGIEGEGIVLRASANEKTNPAPPLAPAQLPSPLDLVDLAQSAVHADPGSAEKLEILGLIEREHNRGTALDHLQAAARRAPNAERWLAVANACPDARCSFDALNQALRRDEHNPKVLLAIADYYLARKQVEKARERMESALAFAPHDFVLRDRLADFDMSTGEKASALKQSLALENAFPGPLWLRRKLSAQYASRGLLNEALRVGHSVLTDDFDNANQRELLARIHRSQHNAVALQRLYSQSIIINPNDSAALASLAELNFATGDPSAESLMQRAIAIRPDDAALRQRYADLLARAGRSGAERTQLARAIELDPHLENVQRRLRLTPSAADRDPDSAYLENPTTLVAAASCETSPEDNVVSLADVQIDHLYANGLSTIRQQQIICIATDQGARDYAVRSIQYAPESQQLQVLHARIYKKNGQIVDAGEGGEGSVANTSYFMYYDVRSREVRFPGLQKGDLIELDYRISPTTDSNLYGVYFANLVAFRSSVPQALKRYVIVAPVGRVLNVVEARMPAPALHEIAGNSQILRWEARKLAALPNEPRGPSVTETSPYVHVSTFSSWNEVGRWYAQLIRPQFALDSKLHGELKHILANKITEVEKISAIHQFVLRSTHYVALEFGIYSYKPYPVSQVYERRFGDCKDKASLMIALLREAGIEADIALVRTRRLGDIDRNATSIALFDHAIVYVPKWDLWLDGTAEYAGSHELPMDDQGALALVVSLDGNASLRRIPVTRPDDNFTRRTVRAQISPDGAIDFDGVAFTRGEEAPGLRREYEIPERRRESVRTSLAAVFPTVRVDDVSVDGATDLERDINVQFRGTLDTFTGHSVVPLATSWMPRSYVQSLAPQATRTEDLLLPAPWTTEEELRFHMPANARLTSVPRDFVLQNDFGSIQVRYQRNGRDLTIKTSVQFRKIRITPAEYPAFREFCAEAERAFREELKVDLRG